jgi:hypothetical protein
MLITHKHSLVREGQVLFLIDQKGTGVFISLKMYDVWHTILFFLLFI